jgi:hypothetical protein
LWTISAPANYRPASLTGAVACGRLDHELTRSRQLRALANLAADRVAEGSPETLRQYVTWARRWTDALEAAKRQVDRERDPDRGEAGVAELTELENARAQLAEKLERGDTPAEPDDGATSMHGPAETWLRAREQPGTPIRAVGEKGSESISITYRPVDTGRFGRRVFLASVLAAVALAAVLAIACGWFSGLFQRWPHVFGVAIGLAWWLWLWPGVVGWAIILLVLASGARPGWRRIRPAGSSVIAVSYGRR